MGKLNPMTREQVAEAVAQLRRVRGAAQRGQADDQQRRRGRDDFEDLFEDEFEVEEAGDVEADLFGA